MGSAKVIMESIPYHSANASRNRMEQRVVKLVKTERVRESLMLLFANSRMER